MYTDYFKEYIKIYVMATLQKNITFQFSSFGLQSSIITMTEEAIRKIEPKQIFLTI